MAAATKKVIVLCGLPFSGKTTYVKQFLDEDTLLVERDRILETLNADKHLVEDIKERAKLVEHPTSTLFPTTYDNACNDLLTMAYTEHVAELIKNTTKATIIVDGTHLQPLSRSFIKNIGSVQARAVVMDTSATVCIERLQQGIHSGLRSTVTPSLITKMAAVFEPPTTAEGFEEITVI